MATRDRSSPQQQAIRPPFRRCRLAAALAGVAVAALPSAAAWADSGTGVDTVLGNALNPAGITSARPRDVDSHGMVHLPRSPTGFIVAEPFRIRAPFDAGSGWVVDLLIEAGVLWVGGDEDAAKFREYKSLEDGFILNNFWVQAERPADAAFVQSYGGGIPNSDQYASLAVGRYNAWRLNAFYNETPHVFTTRYRNLWSGTGGGTLTLNGLPAGPTAPATAASTDAAIGAVALATPDSTLEVIRKKGGLRVDARLSSEWKLFAALSSERRQGARSYGLVSGGGGGTGGVEIPESVDYDTHDIAAGVQWSTATTSLNVQASASLFRNNLDTQTIENPMFVAAANGLTRFPVAVFDLYPDNDFYNVKAEFAQAWPEFHQARLTALASASSSRQNDALIPATPYAGVVVGGVAGGSWNTTASLSRTSADASIDSRLFDVGFALTPTAGLDVKAAVRYYETSNDTDYLACNPLTGQWGRLVNEGSGGQFATPNLTAGNNPAGTAATAYNAARCDLDAVRALALVPAAGNVNIRNVPYEYRQVNASLAADYRIARNQTVTATYERENFDREHRERDETWEDRFRLGYVNRAFPGGTLRLSAEYGRRRGSAYVSDPYDEFASGSFGPLPTAATTNVTSWIHVNDLHRKYDLADRDQTVLNLRWNHAPREDMDVAVNAQYKDRDYPDSAYGRNGSQRQGSIGIDVNWQPTERTNVYGFASWQEGRMEQDGLQQNACVIGTTYYFFSDGSVATSSTRTPAQVAAGITVVGNSGPVTAANFTALCGTASPTSPLYPKSRAWQAAQKDRNALVGIGVQHDFGRALVDVTYQYAEGRTSLDYTYNPAALGLVTSGAPTAAQLTALALIGDGMPDIRFRQQTVEANVLVPLANRWAVRLLLRYENGRLSDYHYDGVAANPTPSNNQQTYLDAGPEDYSATVVGLLFQYGW